MALEHPWREPPAPGRTLAVASGVHWLRMPLPFQLDHINLWLLEDGPGWVVVDTGLGLADTRALWDRALAGEMRGRPLTRVVVTHFHPDHMGNAGWLGERASVDLWCTQGEWLLAQHAWRTRDAADLEARLAHYRRNGCDETTLARLRGRGNHYPTVVPTLPAAFRRLRDGDSLAIGGRAWRVLTGEGHSPEHACLWGPEAGVLIAGDQVLPKITTNISVWSEEPRGNPLRLYLDSLGRFEPMPADTLVLPSHGLPFRGLPERLRALADHHEARLAEALDQLGEPRSLAEVAPRLFRRELDSHQLGFALGETLAHLHFLEAEGRVVRLVGVDGVHRFAKA
jgi:glyoxylase-like metal-dependent hydrolase (beta-lactamase superfamily II)